MFSIVTLNVNGIHHSHKWKDLWQNLPRSNIICLQETHLTKAQEFASELHCQGYLWYYLHGTSNSAGVGVVVKKSLNIESRKIGEIPG